MATEHQLRVSDADRHRLVAALDRHTAAGRLDLDEYSDRVDQALRARTFGELAAIMADLPAEPPADGGTGGRQLVVAFLVALLALLVIGVAVAAFR
jgi:hypothetical protein